MKKESDKGEGDGRRATKNELERKSERRQGQGMTVECKKSCEGTEVEQIV